MACINPNEKYKDEQYKKNCNHESILSLLVKLYFKNKDKKSASSHEPRDTIAEFEFLKPSSTSQSDVSDEFSFRRTRIGDENDFIHNLLEQAYKLSEKCRLNIEKTVESLKEPSPQIFGSLSELEAAALSDSQSLNTDTTEMSFLNRSASEGASSSENKLDDELLKSKKSKAKARQQKLLAQMSSNQKAFLSNPVNKIDIDAYIETSTVTTKKPADNTDGAAVSTLNAIDTGKEASSVKQVEEKEQVEEEEIYDCCICRLSTKATPDRPIGVVTLLQVTYSFFKDIYT